MQCMLWFGNLTEYLTHRHATLAGYIGEFRHRAYPHLVPRGRFAPDVGKDLKLHERPMPIHGTSISELDFPPANPFKGITTDAMQVLGLIDRSRPHLMNGLMEYWKEYKTEQMTIEGTAEYLGSDPVGLNVQTGSGEERYAQLMLFTKEYFLKEEGAITDDDPLILYSKHATQKLASRRQDLWVFPEDLFSPLYPGNRPNIDINQFEPFRGGLPIQRSRFGHDYWSALTEGRKLWIVFPPTITREQLGVEYRHRCGNEWYHNEYLPNLLGIPGRLEFIQEPGQVVYVPRHWWFKWISLGDTNSSVSRFFVDRVNVRHAWRDMAGSLPEVPLGPEIRDIQDPYGNGISSSTLRLHPFGLRACVWPFWKHLLMSGWESEEQFWLGPDGVPHHIPDPDAVG